MTNSMLDCISTPCLGVVPIFVNAGAALLPAILAGLTSVLAVLFRPRAWGRLCKNRPQLVLLAALAVAAIYPASVWVARNKSQTEEPTTTRRAGATRGVAGVTWAEVALEIIRQQERSRLLGLASRGETLADSPPRREQGPYPLFRPTQTPCGLSASDSLQAAITTAMMYRGDASRCGYAGGPSPGPLVPVPLWQFAREDTMYASSPVVCCDAVYGAACVWEPTGLRGFVFCLDAATGELRWQTESVQDAETGEQRSFRGICSSPAVSADGQYLVIGQGFHEDANSELICLHARTGRLHWLAKTPLHIESSPAIEGDLVIVGAGAIEEGAEKIVRGHPGLVVAVRISDGRKLWEYQVNDPEAAAALVDGVAYVGAGIHGNAVLALRTAPEATLQEKGLNRLLWKASTPAPVTSAITLTDELVLTGCGHGDYVEVADDPHGVVVALDRRTGERRWEVPVNDAVFGPIAVRNGIAFCPVRSGQIVALDVNQGGRIRWSCQVRGKSPVLTGPAVTDEHVFVVTGDGYLVVLRATDGQVLAETYINAKDDPGEMGLCSSSPFVAHGRVYVGSETGGLRCYTAARLDPQPAEQVRAGRRSLSDSLQIRQPLSASAGQRALSWGGS